MRAERIVGLLGRDDQKVCVGVPRAGVEIHFLLTQAERAWIARMAIGVKVRHHRDIDPQRAKRRNPRRLEIERAEIGYLLVEVRMEMADCDLVAG